jgi:hypothetical protein
MGILLVLLAVAVLVLIVGALSKKQGKPAGTGGKMPSKMEFYSKGKESGFSSGDIKILHELANKSHLEFPLSLFWSKRQLDNCIKTFVGELMRRRVMDVPENEAFLTRLFTFREKMEMQRPINSKGIESSRSMDRFQHLRVVVPDVGVFTSKVIKNNLHNFIIERPDCSLLPVNFQWKTQKVQIYFLRKVDASYYFDSMVEEEIIDSAQSTLRLSHSSTLERNQQRYSIRAKTHRSALLYPSDTAVEEANGRVVPRVQCLLEDISEKGCSVTVGGTVTVGFRLIVEFTVGGMQTCISGVVRDVEFNGADNTSLLHIHADFVPQNAKNRILSLVLGMIDDGPDVVPHVEKEGTPQPDSELELAGLTVPRTADGLDEAAEPDIDLTPPASEN